MKVDLCLMQRPLAGAANQEHDFCFNGFDVDGVLSGGILVTPNVHGRFFVMMPPGVPVVAVTPVG